MAKSPTRISIPGLDQPLTEDEARRIASDPVFAVFVLMQLSGEVARLKQVEARSPHAPPSATPLFQKPTAPSAKKRRVKRGAKVGHAPHQRPAPQRIDRTEEHHCSGCPRCGGPVTALKGKSSQRTRIVIDIPSHIEPEVVGHTIHRAWCPACRDSVEPVVADALPNAVFGHRLLVMLVWLRFSVGVSLSQLRTVFGAHFNTKISEGAIIKAGYRLTDILLPWYDEIGAQVRAAGVVNADETGWRTLGRTHWLWCFTSADATYYHIDRSRGSPVVAEFLKEAFVGTLVSDFWNGYRIVEDERRQVCLAHLLRELHDVNRKKPSDNYSWQAFYDMLRRVLKDAIRLSGRTDREAADYARKRKRLQERLALLHNHRSWEDPDAQRLAKRLDTYQSCLLTFLDRPDVPFHNNDAERELRPAVVLRKRIQGNQSDDGARTQAIMMSVFRTLQKRGQDPLATLTEALKSYTKTGKLPPLPDKIAAEA